MDTDTCQCPCRQPGTGLSVRGALGYLARSALDLHKYRYLRTRILHDSLDRFDRLDRKK